MSRADRERLVGLSITLGSLTEQARQKLHYHVWLDGALPLVDRARNYLNLGRLDDAGPAVHDLAEWLARQEDAR